MKKILAIFLTSVLFLAAFAGCSKPSSLDPDNPVTLTMWHVYGEQSDSQMNRLVSEFNSTVGMEKGIVIQVTNVTNTNKLPGQLQEAKEGAPGAPEMPDLFSSSLDIADTLGTENLLDWDEYFTEEERNEYVSEFVERGRLDADSALTVFPVSMSTQALFINASQFERFSAETGITYDALLDWEDFFETAEAYYEWSGGKPLCALDYLIRYIEIAVEADGKELPYNENGWYDESDAVFKAAFMKFAESLVKGHIVVSEPYATTQVMTGDVLSGLSSSAAIAYYNDTVTYQDNTSEPMKLKVLPLPRNNGEGEEFYPVAGAGISALKTTEQKGEAASIFLHWFTEAERNLDFVVETGYMPVHNGAFEAIDDYGFENEGYESLYSSIKVMRDDYVSQIRPYFADYNAKVNALYAGIKERCPKLNERYYSGEKETVLAEELWEFFCTID